MALDGMSVSGAALSALLTSLTTSPADADGLILGAWTSMFVSLHEVCPFDVMSAQGH